MTADLTARVAELAAAIEANLGEDEAKAKRNTSGGLGDDGRFGPSYPDYQTYTSADTEAADDYIACSQAQKGDGLLSGPTGPPGSGCSDHERACKPCDCGRDAKVVRMLEIIASEWEA